MAKKISTALISVFSKENLVPLAEALKAQKIKIISTGGTLKYLEENGFEALSVESLTGYPSIFGGRVKTLHPIIFGGILYQRGKDDAEANKHEVGPVDLVVVDLYPFEETLAKTSDEAEIIEKIDIGGVSLIRAAAKNYKDCAVISHQRQYSKVTEWLKGQAGELSLEQRKELASEAFNQTAYYDSKISEFFNYENSFSEQFITGQAPSKAMRYGENPHQKGAFYGQLEELFEQIAGKDLSYNNLVDVDAAINLIAEFDETGFGIIKHTNACGAATADSVIEAYEKALAADPVSAFGGIFITNSKIDLATAVEINKIKYDILLASDFDKEALDLLLEKKNRTILKLKKLPGGSLEFKSLLNGVLVQEKDLKKITASDLTIATKRKPSDHELESMLFANILVKHGKSNCIVLARKGQLIASGVGQTSRVDALEQAIAKAKRFGFELKDCVMASDAFFPFPDCVEIADKNNIKAIIQPGGSINDQKSIDYCNEHNLTMAISGYRHFKH